MARPHWKEAAGEIRSRLDRNPHLLLASDFDGTLSPIVDRPGDAALADSVVRHLREIDAMDPRCRLAFVSGREIGDLGKRVLSVAPSAILVGNHGLEIESNGWRWRHPAAGDIRSQLDQIASLLGERIRRLRGIEIEDKGLSLTVHYRRAEEDDAAEIGRAVAGIVLPDGISLHHGKMIFELRPKVDWHKGRALRLIVDRLGLPDDAVAFLGDDVTDEDVFREFSGKGYTVHVGPAGKPSAARFNAEDPDDVAGFLEMVAAAARIPYRK